VLSSSLALSTILALALNLVLNAGVSNRARLRLAIDGSTNEVISRFFEKQGASWGARPDVIRRAGPATTEWCEEIRQIAGPAHADIEMEFDEFQLATTISCPQLATLLADDRKDGARASLTRIASAIERRYECRSRLVDDRSVRLNFEH
jgi:NCS2 family nucleobase:cation symporter-2